PPSVVRTATSPCRGGLDRLAPFIAQREADARGSRGLLRSGIAGRQLADEVAMIGHLVSNVFYHFLHILEEADELFGGDELRHRIRLHFEALAEQDLDPALLGEQLLCIVFEEAA